MSDESDLNLSDEDFDISEENHAKLLENVINLDDKQYIKKATRTEPSTEISEFHLVNSLTGKEGSVFLKELSSALKKEKKFVKVDKQLKDFQKKSKTLEKPLEKPQEERLKRSIAYENVKKDLKKWDPIVTHNRAATNLSFPLVKDVNLDKGEKFVNRFRIKSDIQKAMDEIEPKMEVFNIEEENKFPLTMEEIKERRQEAAKLRALHSYKAAKAKRESKIKSKKFHRIQRKERLKKELKEFEELQKTNPEEALKKLNEIEKARAEERVTLRHKSTGKWARNKQIRAKYDKESRQALAEQLQISRELTKKDKINADSDSDEDILKEENGVKVENKDDNPWTGTKADVSEEMQTFLSGYKKFWNEQNLKLSNNNEIKIQKEDSMVNDLNENLDQDDKVEKNENKPEKTIEKSLISGNKKRSKKDKSVVKDNKRVKKNKRNSTLSTSNWEVSTLDTNTIINNMSLIINDKLKKSLEIRAQKIKKQLNLDKKTKNTKTNLKKNKSKKYTEDLTLPSKVKYPKINEKMSEDTNINSKYDHDNADSLIENELEKIMNLANQKITTEKPKDNSTQKNIDPNKFLKAKPVNLKTGIPNLMDYEDNVEDENQQSAIAEAFEDDEVIDDFKKEKQTEIEKEKPADVDLFLPGWGSWGGTGIQISKRKRKRFITKFPKKIPRKDAKKGNLIVKDNIKAVKPHLVSEVPFPFKSVKDFEASIRAPVGNTFVPETSFRKNILPAVMTKMGTIIEPVNSEILLKKKKK